MTPSPEKSPVREATNRLRQLVSELCDLIKVEHNTAFALQAAVKIADAYRLGRESLLAEQQRLAAENRSLREAATSTAGAEIEHLRREIYRISDDAGICLVPLGDPSIGRVRRLAEGLRDAESALATERQRRAQVEQALRKEWWFNHGCPFAALYGDDGEMQCNNIGFHGALDFKRLSFDELEQRIDEIRGRILNAAMRQHFAKDSHV